MKYTILAICTIIGLGFLSGYLAVIADKKLGGGFHNATETIASTTTYSGILPIAQGGLATSSAPGTNAILVGNGGTYIFVTGATKVIGGSCTSTYVSGILTTSTCS